MAKFGKSGWNNAKIAVPKIAQPASDSSENRLEAPIARIRQGRMQPRSYIDEEHIQQLIASFTEHGFSGSVPVIQVEDDPNYDYEFIGGHTTAIALARMGKETIAISIQAIKSDLQLAEFSYQHNAASRPLSALDDTTGIITILQEHFRDVFGDRPSIEELAKLFSQIRRKVAKIDRQKVEAIEAVWERNKLPISIASFSSARIPLLSLPEDLKDAITQHSLSPNIAIELGKVNETERSEILERALTEGMTVADIKQHVKKAKGTQTGAESKETHTPNVPWQETYKFVGKQLRKIDFGKVPPKKQQALLKSLEQLRQQIEQLSVES